MGKRKRDPNWSPAGSAPGPVPIIELRNTMLKPGDPIPPPVEPLSWARARNRSRHAVERILRRVAKLPDSDRALLEMLYFRKQPAKQVAAALGITRKELYIRYGEILGRLARPRRRPPEPPKG
jgi:DNA-directed RNA polymerase specialized sigma24 family protein